jgi:hypothetical protein
MSNKKAFENSPQGNLMNGWGTAYRPKKSSKYLGSCEIKIRPTNCS